MTTFSETMRARMDELGINGREVARRSGVSESYVSRLLSGERTDPAWSKACAIIDALELTREEFAARQRGALA